MVEDPPQLVDRWGRAITYLRVSVTDRCNLRCVYCMPPEGLTWRPRDQILRYEEIVQVVQAAAQAGVRRVRLTGGEPLVRRDLPDLVRMIADTPDINEVSLTTNGLLLASMARALRAAGLDRVNISLDSFDPATFARITRGGSLRAVLDGIEAAEQAGLSPIKINVVAMRGINDTELLDIARLTYERSWHIRLIELMPVENQRAWGADFADPALAYLPLREILAALRPLGLVAVPSGSDGPAREYQLPGAKGRIGLISPRSEHFCARCNRLRLTADGSLRACLLDDHEIPLLDALRRGEPLLPYLLAAVSGKQQNHHLSSQGGPGGRHMSQIGG